MDLSARYQSLLDAIHAHRDTLDAAALHGSQKDRDDVDNDLYNVAYLVENAPPPTGAVEPPERIYTDAHAGSILTASARLAEEMRALGDTVVEYVRADHPRGAVSPGIRTYIEDSLALLRDGYIEEARTHLSRALAALAEPVTPRGAVDREQIARIAAAVWLGVERDDEWAEVDGYDRDRCYEVADRVAATPRGAVDPAESEGSGSTEG